ncbi:MAG: TrkA family potassium uptake protein, partial [Ilumatobacteraceae bacterium]
MSDKIIHSVLSGLTADRVEHQGEIIVVGLGRFGSSLARTLVDLGYEVLGVDSNEDIVQDHAGALTHVVQADTTNERALRQIGAADAVTAVVCIGTGIEASVLTTTSLVDLGVKNIWAKAITESHGRILQRVGAHHVVFPEAEMGSRVAHLVTGQMLEFLALDDDFVIAEMRAPADLVGIELGASNLRAK